METRLDSLYASYVFFFIKRKVKGHIFVSGDFEGIFGGILILFSIL